MKYSRVNLTKHACFYKGRRYEYFCLRWFGSDGRQKGKSLGRANGPHGLSRRGAEIIRRRKEVEINEHPDRRDAVRVPGLEDFLEHYLRQRKPELRPSTFLLHKETAVYLRGYFGDLRPIDQVTKLAARDFKTALANGDLQNFTKRSKKILRPATVDKHIRNARTIFNRAVDVGFLVVNPFKGLSSQITVEKGWHHLTMDDYNKLLDAAPNLNWKVLIALCRIGGLRLHEALNLEWEDVNQTDNTLRIAAKNNWQPKTPKIRYVPIFKEMEILLLEIRLNSPKGYDGKKVVGKLPLTNLHKVMVAICRNAGVEPYTKPFHTLRKNAIEDWRRTFPGHFVAAWAGHSSLETTDGFYTRLYPDDFKGLNDQSIFAQKLAKKIVEIPIDKSIKNGKCLTSEDL